MHKSSVKKKVKKKPGKRPQKKQKDMGSFFFRLTQIAMLCMVAGDCYIFYQAGYIQTVLLLHE